MVVSCASLGMFEPFDGSCFEHAPSKVCQYVIMDEKMAHGLSCTSIKIVQIDIKKSNVLPKKFGMEGKDGRKCIDSNLKPKN